MGAPEQPDWVKQFTEGMAEVGKNVANLVVVAKAQAAMGWAFRGDLDKAKETVEEMPAERLLELAAAAATVAQLAFERAREVGTG